MKKLIEGLKRGFEFKRFEDCINHRNAVELTYILLEVLEETKQETTNGTRNKVRG